MKATCCYCNCLINLDPSDDFPDELFKEGDVFERTCPDCGKRLSICPIATWSYDVDKIDSDILNYQYKNK
jgi:hypothetical protein